MFGVSGYYQGKRSEKADSGYRNPDNDPRGAWITSSYVNPATKEARPNLVYGIKNPITGAIVHHPTHAWKYSQTEHKQHVAENRLYWAKDGDAEYPRLKIYLSDQTGGMVPVDVWDYKSSGTTDDGGAEIKELFGAAVFDTPKPTRLIQRILGIGTTGQGNEIIVDFLLAHVQRLLRFFSRIRRMEVIVVAFLFKSPNRQRQVLWLRSKGSRVLPK